MVNDASGRSFDAPSQRQAPSSNRTDRRLVIGLLLGCLLMCGGLGGGLVAIVIYLPRILPTLPMSGELPPPPEEPFRFEGIATILSNSSIREESTYDSRGFPQSLPNQRELVELALAGQYGRLEEIFSGYQRDAEQDFHKEVWMTGALWAFQTSNPMLEPKLTEWVEQYPKSPFALMARAQFYYQKGWDSRGTGWMRDTSEAQVEGMLGNFQKAEKDVRRAHGQNPNIVAGYSLLLGMVNAGGPEFGTERDHLRAGLRANPNSMWHRNAYMGAIRPRWGGSYGQMVAFADDAQEIAEVDPRVWSLYGWIPWDQATLTEDLDRRIELCTTALQYGERTSFYGTRAKAYRRLSRHEEALADFARAVEIWPYNTEYWAGQIEMLAELGRWDKADAALAEAERLHGSAESDLIRARTRLERKRRQADATATSP